MQPRRTGMKQKAMKDALDATDRLISQSIQILSDEEQRLKERLATVRQKREELEAVLTTNPPARPARRQPSSRGGKRGPAPVPTEGPFAGLSVKEAVEKIMREKPEIRPPEIRDLLQAAGYPFRAREPYNTVWVAVNAITQPDKNGTGSPQQGSSGAT